ncbi:MAG: DUF2512 family protein [Chitinophagales bacterium]
MKTTMALVVKFIATLVGAGLAFSVLDNNPFSYVLLIAIVGTAVNYLVGDLVLLPAFGNAVASVCDGILAVGVALIVDLFSRTFNTGFGNYVVFGVVVLVAEYFFHIYIKKSDEVAP